MSDIPSPIPPVSTPSEDTARTLQAAPQVVKRSLPMALSIALGILVAASLFWFVYQVIWFLLLLYLSFVIATIIDAPVSVLCRRGLVRTPVAVALMGAIVALIIGLGYVGFAYASSQMGAISQDFQHFPQHVDEWVLHFKAHWPMIGQYLPQHDITTQVKDSLPSMGTVAESGLKTVEILTYAVVVFFLVLYMVVEGPSHLKALRRVFPKHSRLEVTGVFEEVCHVHRAWFVATITNFSTSSVMTAIALYIVGIPGAFILGLIAGLGELVPNIGPLISNAPIFLFTLIVAPQKIWLVLLAFLVVQTIQGYGISPLMMKRTVRLPVLATIVSIIVMGTLFHTLGVIIAIPLTADLVVLWGYGTKHYTDPSEDASEDTVNAPPEAQTLKSHRTLPDITINSAKPKPAAH